MILFIQLGKQMAWQSPNVIYWQSKKAIAGRNRKVHLIIARRSLNESDPDQ